MLKRAIHLLIVLLAAVPCANALERDAVEQTAHQFIALAHEGAFAALDSLSMKTVPGRLQYERRMRGTLRVRCVRLEGMTVRELTFGNGAATIEIEIAVTKSDRRTPSLWLPPEITSLRLRCIRRDDRWLVAAVEFPDDELADAILAGASYDPARITAAVVRVAAWRTRDLLSGNDPTKAHRAAEVVRKIAAAVHDPEAQAIALGVIVTVVCGTDRDAGRALEAEMMAIAANLHSPDALAIVWIARGNVESMADQHSAATDAAYEQALAFAEHGENPHLTINAMHIVGSRAFVIGDHFTTRALLERSLPLIREHDDWSGAIWYDMQLSYIYFLQEDYARSLHHLERGLELAGKHDAWLLPWAQLRLVETYIAMERFDEARMLLERVRWLYEKKSALRAVLLTHFANIEAEGGNLEEAECLVREAGVHWKAYAFEYGPPFDVLLPHLAKRGQYADVLRLSLEHASHLQQRLPIGQVKALTFVAEAYHALGFSDRAMAAISEAIDVRETLHEQISGAEEQQARSSEWTAKCYELAAVIALGRGAIQEALAFVERGRGRVLYDTLRGERRAARGAKNEIEDTVQRRHEELLARLQRSLEAAESSSGPDPALRARLDAARREYQTFLDGVDAREERRSRSKRPVDGSSIRELLRTLPRGVAAVEYIVRDDRIHVFVARTKESGEAQITLQTAHLDRAALERRVFALVEKITKRDFRYRAEAHEVYDLLLAPIETAVAGADTLLIVPDDVLWRVPFAALVDDSGRFAIERWAIVHAPSISVYAAMARRDTGDRAAGVLALANPTLEPRMTEEVASFYRDVTLGPLPDAEREADALCALYGARHCVALKRREATETRARSAIAGNRIVHFATHGVLDDRNPMYSRLILGRGEGATDDGALEAWEIARLDVDAELVILSACDTARGAIGGGEGVVGMAWAFFVAGARSTVASQWKVSSEATADLMIAFHRSLRARGGLRKARALRDAQLAILRDPRTNHPFYWAGFVILGDAS